MNLDRLLIWNDDALYQFFRLWVSRREVISVGNTNLYNNACGCNLDDAPMVVNKVASGIGQMRCASQVFTDGELPGWDSAGTACDFLAVRANLKRVNDEC